MSGTSERMSTIPASAIVLAGEICGGASAWAAKGTIESTQAAKNAACFWRFHPPLFVIPAKARTQYLLRDCARCKDTGSRISLRDSGVTSKSEDSSGIGITSVLPCECEVLVVIAEIRIRIDLGHVQRTVGLGREIQPGFGIAVEPVHEVLVADAHDFAREVGRFLRGKLHLVAARANAHFAEPWVAPHAELALQLGRRGGFARRRVGHARDAALLIGALQLVGVALDGACPAWRGEMLGQHFVEHAARIFG